MFNTLNLFILCVVFRFSNQYVTRMTHKHISPRFINYEPYKNYRAIRTTLLPDSFLCKSSFQCENFCCAILYKPNHPLSTGYCCNNGRLAIENFYTND